MTLFIGRVTYFHRSATYVRIEIPGYTGSSLDIKATHIGFDCKLFTKGTVVEVEQAKFDGAKFRITRVFTEYNKYEPEVDCDCGEETVRFWIGSQYSPCYKSDEGVRMVRVLTDALGFRRVEAEDNLREGSFWIICRESQFTRFMIARNEEGIPNLFQALKVEYHREPDSSPEIDVSTR